MSKSSYGRMREFDPSASDWSIYRREINNYFISNEFRKEDDAIKCAIFLSVCNEEGYKLLLSLCAPYVPEDKKFSDLEELLNKHYKIPDTTFAARYEFYNAFRGNKESASEWAARIRSLASSCNFDGSFVNNLMRDRFIIGFGTGDVRDRLFEENKDVTLEEAVEIATSKMTVSHGAEFWSEEKIEPGLHHATASLPGFHYASRARNSITSSNASTCDNIKYKIDLAALPNKGRRKYVKRGFDFTMMVVGECGLGKSTLINSIFSVDLYKDRNVSEVSERLSKTTAIEKKTMKFEDKGVNLRLTIVDTPGFGDAVNCEDNWKVCTNYIDEQFRQYFTDISCLHRRNIQDNRVHCCLYFVPPWGHSLRQMDIELMKRLHRKVNIVVVIAKADTLTVPEVQSLKRNILNDINDNNIQIYELPDCDSDEDDDFKERDREMKASIPFAVVGSNTTFEVNGKKVRGRQYPWGLVDVENPDHSDFVKLRTMLIYTHTKDLKVVTEDVHYENFCAQCISQMFHPSNSNMECKEISERHKRIMKPPRFTYY